MPLRRRRPHLLCSFLGLAALSFTASTAPASADSGASAARSGPSLATHVSCERYNYGRTFYDGNRPWDDDAKANVLSFFTGLSYSHCAPQSCLRIAVGPMLRVPTYRFEMYRGGTELTARISLDVDVAQGSGVVFQVGTGIGMLWMGNFRGTQGQVSTTAWHISAAAGYRYRTIAVGPCMTVYRPQRSDIRVSHEDSSPYSYTSFSLSRVLYGVFLALDL